MPTGEGKDVCELVLGDLLAHGSSSSSVQACYRDLFRIAFYLKARQIGLPTTDVEILRREIARDLEARVEMGTKKYGTRLKTNNGREARIDLLQEVYDALMYARQDIEERE